MSKADYTRRLPVTVRDNGRGDGGNGGGGTGHRVCSRIALARQLQLLQLLLPLLPLLLPLLLPRDDDGVK